MTTNHKNMTWDKAILTVLSQVKAPMKYYDIAETIIAEGLRDKNSVGATPANTVNSYLHSDKLKDKVVCVNRGEYVLKSVLDENPASVVSKAGFFDPDDDDEISDTLITAYGRYWNRDMFENNKCSLLGINVRTPKTHSVDFSQHSGIYILHHGHSNIYVGQAKSLKLRLAAHLDDGKRNRWDSFSWFSLTEFDKESPANNDAKTAKSLRNESILDTLEALLIETLAPERNKKVGNSFEDKEFEQIPELSFLKGKVGKSK